MNTGSGSFLAEEDWAHESRQMATLLPTWSWDLSSVEPWWWWYKRRWWWLCVITSSNEFKIISLYCIIITYNNVSRWLLTPRSFQLWVPMGCLGHLECLQSKLWTWWAEEEVGIHALILTIAIWEIFWGHSFHPPPPIRYRVLTKHSHPSSQCPGDPEEMAECSGPPCPSTTTTTIAPTTRTTTLPNLKVHHHHQYHHHYVVLYPTMKITEASLFIFLNIS